MFQRCGLCILTAAVVLAGAASAQAATLYLTTAGDAKLGANELVFKEGDIVAYNTETQIASIFFNHMLFRKSDGSLGAAGVNVDAMHVLADGRMYISAGANGRLGSNMLLFEDGDIVLYDPVADTASMVFKGDTTGTVKGLFRMSNGNLGADEDVDALHVLANGNMVLSTRGDARLGSNLLSFTEGDLVEYNLATDQASLYFSHMNFLKTDGVTPGGAGNIDALAILSDSELLLSTTDTARLGSPVLKFEHGDLVLYNTALDSASIFLDQDAFLKQCNGSNIDGVSLLTFSEDLSTVPEPLTCGTLALALGALARYTRRRNAR